MFRAANRYYRFDIEDVIESIQIAQYKEGDFIDWHTDTGNTADTRKITITTLLSRREDDAGQLEICPPIRDSKQHQGDAVIFPSYTPHRVTGQRLGERWSLTAWAHGKPFC